MKWPWVSRKSYDEAVRQTHTLHDRWVNASAAAQNYARALEIEKALRRDEQWRRLKAEGQLAYVLDRARQARELMLPYVADEPPTMKRKAIPE